MSKAIVMLSGGMDSTAALFWALPRYDSVRALTIDYRQRHGPTELVAADAIAKLAGVERDYVWTDTLRQVSKGAALVDMDANLTDAASSVVPGRNLFLLTIALSFAVKHGARDIIVGACADDQEAYADCRAEFFVSASGVLSLAAGRAVSVCAPFVQMPKRDILLAMASDRRCWDALALSVSCYMGRKKPCAACPACVARARGFAEAGLEDPAIA